MAEIAEVPVAPETAVSQTIKIRPPSKHTFHTAKDIDLDIQAPTFEWLSGTWTVSYTSLPLWNDKQNVRISYAKVDPSASTDKMPDLDDSVLYQKLGQSKDSSVYGISRPVEIEGVPFGMAYSWRGKGWLRVATSQWEVLGWGKDEEAETPNDWVVTSFSKTLFTPAGLDIYTRTKESLSAVTLAKIKEQLEGLADEDWSAMVKSIYEVPRT
jgi:hypothetical protein